MHWDSRLIANNTSVHCLGLHLLRDVSWTIQLGHPLRSGESALRKFRDIVLPPPPRLNVDLQLLTIKTYLVPEVQFGMEFWFPPLSAEDGHGCSHSPFPMHSALPSWLLPRLSILPIPLLLLTVLL
jgi:hypothetical protein